MPKIIDLTGVIFESGTRVLKRIPNTNPIRWQCICACGTPFDKQAYSLKHSSDLCPGCTDIRMSKKKKGKSWSKEKIKKFEKNVCAAEGCSRPAVRDCELGNEYYCREHFINDNPYTQPGVQSTLAHYV